MKKIKDQYIIQDASTRMHGLKVPIIGLTGGIATGKSTCSQFLKEQGFSIICADKLIKQIYALEETFVFIKATFPQSISCDKIDFKKLRQIAFSDIESRETLEKFLYQRLPTTFKEEYHKLDHPSFIIYDVPLLFEKGLHKLLDQTICVYSPRKTQMERLLKRDHISSEFAEKILSHQLDIEEKKNRADFIIENTSGLEELKKSTSKVFNSLN